MHRTFHQCSARCKYIVVAVRDHVAEKITRLLFGHDVMSGLEISCRRTLRITGTEELALISEPTPLRSPVHPMVRHLNRWRTTLECRQLLRSRFRRDLIVSVIERHDTRFCSHHRPNYLLIVPLGRKHGSRIRDVHRSSLALEGACVTSPWTQFCKSIGLILGHPESTCCVQRQPQSPSAP